MIQGVIFDLDGVLVSTDELHYAAWRKLADREEIYFDHDINDRLRGVSRMASLEIILERAGRTYSEDEKQEMAAYKNGLYVDMLNSLTPADALEGVVETLDALAEKGVRLAVGSSSKNAKRILGRLGLLSRFDAIADGTDITRSKPDPEVFLCAAQKLGLAPAECAVVEDAEAGIQAAKAGGMTALAVGQARSCSDCDMRMDAISEVLRLWN